MDSREKAHEEFAEVTAQAAVMREALEAIRDGEAYPNLVADAAIATDVGAGYVSPERHAEVVRERDEARADEREEKRHADEAIARAAALRAKLEAVTKERDEARAQTFGGATRDTQVARDVAYRTRAKLMGVLRILDQRGTVVGNEWCTDLAEKLARFIDGQETLLPGEYTDDLRAQLAECQAQAAAMREAVIFARESYNGYGYHTAKLDAVLTTDVGKALAERVRLLEAVVVGAHGTFDGNFAALRAALAALDAHDKQHGG